MKYRKGYKYQLAEDEYYQTSFRPEYPIITVRIHMGTNGLMRVMEGYASDGPSGPTFDRKTNMRSGFGHDAEYQLMRMGYLPWEDYEIADEDYGRWMVEDGAWQLTANINMAGLGFAKGKHAKPENRKKVYEV